MNIIMAVNMGGDDFIAKPFDLSILVAKVQALLRRTYSFGGKMNVLEHNGVVLSLSNATIEYKDTKVELIKNELIEDTGIGIAEEDLPRVFEKGFTGYNGRMDKKATGIGLYLCKKILDKLSHKISIISKINVGTTVKIDLSSIKTMIE